MTVTTKMSVNGTHLVTTKMPATGTGVHPTERAKSWEPTDAQRVAILAQGLNISGTNMIEAIDPDWIRALAEMNIDFKAIPPGTDYIAMRGWLQETYLKMDCKVNFRPIRPQCAVTKTHVEVEYGSGNKFGLTIWDPSEIAKGETSRPALLMYHGGGWIHGSPEGDADSAEAFASNLRCVVIGVDYRLAPEYKMPVLVQDCLEALQWTIVNAKRYNIDSSRIGLWGASAGGHLAANVAMLDALNHTPSRICQVSLVVPATCHVDAYDSILAETTCRAYENMGEDGKGGFNGVLSGLRIILGYASGPNMATDDPLISPLRRPLPWPAHHPPTHTTVAGCDHLRDQGIAYSLRLRDQGIDSTLQILPGVPHGFTWAAKSRAASQWLSDQIKLFDNAFRGTRYESNQALDAQFCPVDQKQDI